MPAATHPSGRRNEDMAYSESLATRVRHALRDQGRVVEKRMFGGLAFLMRGNLCVALIDQSLIVRVGPAAYEAALAEPHVREFDFTGRPMRGWVVADPEAIDLDADLLRWIEQAVDFVQTLPAK